MAKIVYGQMPTPQELPQQIPRAKARMQKPQGGGKFLVQIPVRGGGGKVMAKIDTCITTYSLNQWKSMSMSVSRSKLVGFSATFPYDFIFYDFFLRVYFLRLFSTSLFYDFFYEFIFSDFFPTSLFSTTFFYEFISTTFFYEFIFYDFFLRVYFL